MTQATVIPALGTATVNIGDTLAHVATFTAGSAAGTNMVSIDGGLASLTFANPSVALVANANPASDTFTFTSLDAGFNAALTVDAATGPAETVNLNTPLTLGSSMSTGTVCINTDIVNVTQPISTTAVNAGSIILSAATIDLGANLSTKGGNVCLNGGSVVLTAASTIDTEQGNASAAGNVTFLGTLSANAATDNLIIVAGSTSDTPANVSFATLNGAAGAMVNQVCIADANNVTFNNAIAIAGNLTQLAGTGTTTLNGGSIGGALALTNVNLTLNNALSAIGNVCLTVAANGTGTIMGTVASSGTSVNLTGGNFSLCAPTDSPSLSNDVVLGGNTTVTFNNNSQTFGSLAAAGSGAKVVLGSGTLTTGDGVNTSFSGIISGAGGLIKQGADSFALTGVNTYTGATTINGGSLTLGVANAPASSTAVTVNANATFAMNGFNDSVGALNLLGGCVTGPGTLTAAATYNLQSGMVAANLAGAAALTKSTSGVVVITNASTDTYTGATTISGGTLTMNRALSASSSAVTLSAANVTLNGAGAVNRPVVVNAANDTIGSGTIGTANSSTGLTISTSAGVGITVNAAGAAMILGNTIPTGVGKNDVAIEVNAGKALIQDDTLNASGLQAGNFTSTVLPTTTSPYYGILAIGGGIVDAGQVGGSSTLTGLGIGAATTPSSATRTTPARRSPPPCQGRSPRPSLTTTRTLPTAPPGRKDSPTISTPSTTISAAATAAPASPAPAASPPAPASNYTAIEQVVFGDNDASMYGFVNYVAPTATPQLITTQFYSVSSAELTANPDQRSMIRRIDVAFNSYVKITPGAFTLSMSGPAATYAISWIGTGGNNSATIAMTPTQILFDPTTGLFRYEYAFATGQNGVESSGSLTDGEYQLAYNMGLIAGTNGVIPTIGTGTSPYYNPNSATGTPNFPLGVPYHNTTGNNYTLNFHRLFGDMDGMGYIDTYDINAMAAALGHLAGQAGYNADLDYNNDGSIDTTTDYPQFTNRKNKYTSLASSATDISYGWDV